MSTLTVESEQITRTDAGDPPVKHGVSLEQRQAGMAKVGAFLVLGLMLLPVLTGQVYVSDDLVNYHLPIREFYSQCLKSGDAFDWMPGIFSGFYLTGSGQAGTYHPWHWTLYRMLPVNYAFGIELVGSYPLMLAGMVLFLKRHFERQDAAWVGAVIFTFSGFNMLHFLHPNAIAVVAHIPWLLLALDIILRPGSASRKERLAAEVGVAMLTASQLLLGYPQYVWYSLISEIVYCLAYGGMTLAGWRTLIQLGGLKVLGLLLGAVQVLPSAAALAQSDRQHLAADYFYQSPLTLPDMLQWIGPYLTTTRVFGDNTHELGVYCGSLTVLLALSMFWNKDSLGRNGRLVLVMSLLGLLAVWLSLGKAGGLYILQTYLPLVGKFRCPSRIIVLMHLAIAVLAAEGYRRLALRVEQGNGRLPEALKWAPAVCIAAALGTMLFSSRAAAPVQLLIGPVLFFLAWRQLKELSSGAQALGFMLFLVGDQAVYGLNYAILGQTMSPARIQSLIDAPPGDASSGKVIGEIQIANGPAVYKGNKLLLKGWKQADGYEGLVPKIHLLKDNTSLDSLRISGVKWVVNDGAHASIAGLISHADTPGWLEVPDPLPRFRLNDEFVVIEDTEAGIKSIQADGPVVVDAVCRLDDSTYDAPSPLQVEMDRPGLIRVRTREAKSRLLVVSERFDPGWQVTLDGRPSNLVRADLDFMGCVIPAGPHEVEFRFMPESLQRGKTISLAALVVLGLYAGMRGFMRFHGGHELDPARAES